jgi:hypothetical protein
MKGEILFGCCVITVYKNVGHQWFAAEVAVLLTVCSSQTRKILNLGPTVNK